MNVTDLTNTVKKLGVLYLLGKLNVLKLHRVSMSLSLIYPNTHNIGDNWVYVGSEGIANIYIEMPR